MQTKVAQTERRIATMERVHDQLRAELKQKEALRQRPNEETESVLPDPLRKIRGIRKRATARN